MAVSKLSLSALSLLFLLAIAAFSLATEDEDAAEAAAAVEESAVLTLDASNFTDVVSQHPFVVVEFYAPWCGHCKNLAPEYEKAASLLRNHDPPIVLAKVDANEKNNKELAAKYEVQGFPTIKILRKQGNDVQDYKGPRVADGIVEYLKKQVGPASFEIKTAEDAENFIGDQKVVIVGIFADYSGSQYESYMATAEKFRSDYDFGHTLDVMLLPRGDSSAKGPLVRLFKPFDELFVDHKDFDLDALEKFIETSSMPLVTFFDNDPNHQTYLMKYFSDPPKIKAMLFLNFTNEKFEAYKSKLYEAAEQYKGGSLYFLIGDLESSQGPLEYFGLKGHQAPAAIIQEIDETKYAKPNVEPDQIISWLKDYKDGKLTAFRKSEPIPEVNSEPVKVVVADNLEDMVLKSRKNVLLEFYAPWCGHCKSLAPILEEVAVTMQKDDDIVIAKIDATANDVPPQFDVSGYPTMYLSTSSGKLLAYEGDRTAEAIIDFINTNKEATQAAEVKDEL